MRLSQKITHLIGATLIGSVLLAAVFSTIFVLIYEREHRASEAGSDLESVSAFTEKSRSLLLYFDVLSQSQSEESAIVRVLVEDGFAKSYESLERAQENLAGDHAIDFQAAKRELDRLQASSNKLLANRGDAEAGEQLSLFSNQFRDRLNDMDQEALGLAMAAKGRTSSFKYVAYGVLGTLGVLFVFAILWARTRTVQEIVEPIVDLSQAATQSHQTGAKLNVSARGPIEIRTMIDGVQVFANDLRDLVDERTERLAETNKELAKQAEIANAKAAEASELARQAKEASESKSSFLANMSHEIRTPLNGILGMLSLLEDMNNANDQADLIQTAQDSAKSLLGIVNEILDFSKIEANAIEIESIEFDLREPVYGATDLVSLKAQEKGLELIAQLGSDVPRKLLGDPLRIRQLCTNLLGNSLKFTKEGTVIVAVSKSSTQPSSGLRLRFEISDTGMGIPPEKVDTLFNPFSQVDASTTRNFGGTGLGLSICKKLAELMGGAIGVTSELGKGSVFWFEVEVEEDATNAKLDRTFYGNTKSCRAIICEPHRDVAQALEESLKAYSVSNVIVSESESMISMISEGLKSGHAFNRIFIDTRIGAAAAETLAQRLRVASGAAKPELIALSPIGVSRPEATAFSGQISKPVKEQALLQCALGKRGEGKAEPNSSGQGKKSILDSASDFNPSVRILVAEDNKVNQKVIRLMLRRAGLNCELVADGKAAVQRLNDEEFDLVFMDCQMPELDGFEATRQIRRGRGKLRDVPIVALTANALKGYEEKCLKAGMSDFLTKPIDSQNLLSILSKWAPKTLDS